MSYMADRDHIAITSGDASTTRRKFLYRNAQLLRGSLSLTVSLAILIVASCRFRKVPGNYPPGRPGTQFAISYSANARHRLCGDTRRKSSLSYRDIPECRKTALKVTRSSIP
jgi:hypothetical protein